MKRIALLFILCPFFAAHADLTQTTLRVGSPQGTYNSYANGTFITQVRVEVRNAGEMPAKNIRVVSSLPNGKVATLQGPSELGPNKSATYLGMVFDPVKTKGGMSARASCANCR